MKENDSTSVSRKESACNSRTVEERMENSSSSTGGNLTSAKIESKDVIFIVLQKNRSSMISNQQSVKCRTANGMQYWSQRHGDQVKQKYGRQAKVTSSCALENRRTNTVLQSF